MRKAGVAIGFALGAWVASPSQAAPPAPIVITNSGSPRLTGFQVTLSPSGVAQIQQGAERRTGRISTRLLQQLQRHLDEAKPLGKLPIHPCGLSPVHNTRTVICAGDDCSPDLSCPGDARINHLMSDIVLVCGILGVQNLPR